MTVENYVDILPRNDDDNVELFDEDDGNEDIIDMEDNENIENDASLLGGGEHDVPSPIFRELNWDVINSMVDKDLTARAGLWNESNELFKGVKSRKEKAYVSFLLVMQEYKQPLKVLMLDGTRLMHTIDIVLGMWLDMKKWTLAHDEGHQYGWMTTNIVECINGVLKGARMLPITALEVHRSSLIWEGNDPGKLHCRRREASFYRNSVLDAHIIPYLQQSGFYGVARLGLPINGVAISSNTCLDWREVCATLFGVVLEDRDISEQRLRLSWLTGHFSSLAPDVDVEFVRCYAKAFILQLIGGPLILLQLWDRFPFITPMRLHSALHDGILPQPPLGMRPDHVLRQFGLLQHIPEQCDTELGLHKYDLRGRHDLDWTSIHHHYIQRWEAKYDHLARAEATSTSYGHSHPYMVWYCSITRLFLTPCGSSWEIVAIHEVDRLLIPLNVVDTERQSSDEELVMRDGGVRTRGGGVRTRGGGVQTRGDGVRARGGGVRTKGGGHPFRDDVAIQMQYFPTPLVKQKGEDQVQDQGRGRGRGNEATLDGPSDQSELERCHQRPQRRRKPPSCGTH
ncbi:Serine/threonine-protein phosphatase 7 long form-like [Vitis vinifera]|uniref:Serine/threonine-protein phosphatase 7 long form-like n=1 Tax=Vitis vinifera TaxID=29760 RepID=A0A438HP16_VITVI|nr:Serine/threonine-protein phosphatase 7 long form-like [Vitis vinifera]